MFPDTELNFVHVPYEYSKLPLRDILLSWPKLLTPTHSLWSRNKTVKQMCTSVCCVATEWERFASQLAIVWKELAATWINYTKGHEAIVLHFEKIRLNPHHDISRLLDYLGIAVDEQRISCVLNHVDGPFRRPQSSQQMLFSTRCTNDIVDISRLGVVCTKCFEFEIGQIKIGFIFMPSL